MNPSQNDRRKEAAPGGIRIRLRFASAWEILRDAIRNYRTNGDTNQAAAISAALIHAPRTASARSLEESHIAVINGDTPRSLLRDSDDVSLFMLKEFSNRIRHTNEALEELTQSWVRLMAIIYFLRAWPLPEERDPDAELAKITGKETAEIHEVLAELGRRGVLTFADGCVNGFNRDEALRLIDEQVTV